MGIAKSSRIAITGGTGFLGSHIIRGLIEKGFENIVALKRKSSSLLLLEGIEDKVQWVDGDVLDIQRLKDFIEHSDYVIHSAAAVSYNPKDQEKVYRINVEGTANMVNVCLEIPPKKFIAISSVAAIGRVKSGEVIDENSEWTDSQYNTNYAISKNKAEMEVWRGMTEGLNVAILNPSLILGPSYWGDSSTKVLTHVAKGSKLYPTGENGFVDVRDVAALAIHVLDSDFHNERVIAVGEASTYKNLFERIAFYLGSKPPTIKIGKFLGSIAWRIFWLKRVLIGGDPPITSETVRITSGRFLYNNGKSKELFDFEYRKLEETVRDTVEKYKQSKIENKRYAFFGRIFQ